MLNITDGAKSAYYSSINGLKDFGNKLTSLTSDIGTSLKSAAGSLDRSTQNMAEAKLPGILKIIPKFPFDFGVFIICPQLGLIFLL